MSREIVECQSHPSQALVIRLIEYRKRNEEENDDSDTVIDGLESSCEKLQKLSKGCRLAIDAVLRAVGQLGIGKNLKPPLTSSTNRGIPFVTLAPLELQRS